MTGLLLHTGRVPLARFRGYTTDLRNPTLSQWIYRKNLLPLYNGRDSVVHFHDNST